MRSITLFYIVLAIILSLLVAYYQYFHRVKKTSKIAVILFVLRFFSLFLLGVLLINPTIDILQVVYKKPSLAVLIDNSSSTKFFKEERKVVALFDAIKNNEDLQDKFDISAFTFGEKLLTLDSLTFNEPATNIAKAIVSTEELYNDEKLATILISDGNQTSGHDYDFINTENKIFPVVLGDTTKYQDIQITRLNANKYSYIKNKFPVEAMILYEGNENIAKQFVISHKGKKVYSEKIILSPDAPSKTITTYLDSDQKGVQYYHAYVERLSNEKNRKNNRKSFAIEVMDEQTKVVIVSTILHPDLGAIKKAIESNQQRSATIKIIGKDTFEFKDYQFYIFYQPDNRFRDLFNKVTSNFLLITGGKTDWNFINSLKLGLSKEVIQQTENYEAIYDPNFLTFTQKNIGFESFPPLVDKFGTLQLTADTQVLLYQKMAGFSTDQPLLCTIEKGEDKYMFLLGEGIWKWRAANYIEEASFEKFDDFIGNITQYLTSTVKRERLRVEAKKLYPANAAITFTAYYVDKNYRFDKRASLQLKITNTVTKEVQTVPFSLMNTSYQVSVEGLVGGDYRYEVSVENQNIKKYGAFKVTNYQIEEQFVNANIAKLKKLAQQSKGKLYHTHQIDKLIDALLNDTSYFTTQKTQTHHKTLLDWRWVLWTILALFSLEWFIRKYYGKM